MRALFACVIAIAGCGRVAFDARGDGGGGDVVSDTVGSGPWGPPIEIVGLDIGPQNEDPTLPADQLELYFNCDAGPAPDIYVSTRASIAAPWGAPTRVDELSTAGIENTPEIVADGLTIYFNRDGAIWRSTRASRTDLWPPPTIVTELNTAVESVAPVSLPNGLKMYLGQENPDTSYSLKVTSRASTAVPWNAPVEISELAGVGAFEVDPFPSIDDMQLYWASYRAGSSLDIWTARRPAPGQPFGTAVAVPELSDQTVDEDDVWISPDGHTLYYSRGVFASTMNIYTATR